jgi:L-asparaginase
VRVKTLLMIDSLRMKASHRSAILRECARAPEPRIVVTHGTDTMVETAKVLGRSRERALEGKTIVLTGAMVPYRFGSSDGMFNLGSAISFAQSLPPGVFIAMNGRCFPWSSVRKNREKGLFEAE